MRRGSLQDSKGGAGEDKSVLPPALPHPLRGTILFSDSCLSASFAPNVCADGKH